jgi:hypothetical protein
MKNKFFIIMAFLALVSCKDEKAADAKTNEVAVKDNFSVELDVNVSKKDDFTLYYTEDNTVTFVGGNAVWKGVNGGNLDEKILFELSPAILPTNIRLDLGINKDQEKVILKNVKIFYFGNEMSFKGSEFFNWFIVDEKFKNNIDETNGTIEFLKTGDTWVTPYFYPRQELTDKLKALSSM